MIKSPSSIHSASLVLAFVVALLLMSVPASSSTGFDATDVMVVDSATDALDPRGDLLSLAMRETASGWLVRVGMTGGANVDLQSLWVDGGSVEFAITDAANTTRFSQVLSPASTSATRADASSKDPEGLLLEIPSFSSAAADLGDATSSQGLQVRVTSMVDGKPVDSMSAAWPPQSPGVFIAHCALALHGNQGLAYTDAFFGSAADPGGTGFDEALEIHQSTGVPGNFHVSGTLITAAEWDRNQGNPQDFNGWLRTGVAAGWAGMMTSAYAQHMMPFAHNAMNDWAVNTQAQLVATTYNYTPRTAWIPERVWLDPSRYPSNGVIDWPGDNFLPHGVWSVILDDDVHLLGWDNHQIHTLTNGLRVIPRDRSFTGHIVGGNGQSAIDILTGLANSGSGDFRIAVMAEDWEAVGEIGFWSSTTPNAKETYDWFVAKVQTEPWINAWKLDDAVQNPNFNGTTIAQLNTGTYGEIGGADGYGGGNNGWYTNWAGYVPYVTGGDGTGACGGTGNCRNYGAMWDAAYNKLLTVPSNNISEAGWYVLMTNLHETAWHDSMGGPISGWQHKYAAHTKNALVYAEAARWAEGLFAAPTGAYVADLDEDGYDELVLYNERVLAFFEGTGGRAVNVFAKDPGGAEFCAVGVDNAYWFGTDADFNDGNHVGAFSDVGPDRQHEAYSWNIDSASGSTVQVTFTHASGLEKTFSLDTGQPYIRSVYRTHNGTQWIQTGMSPGLVDLIWNADMDRVWATDQAYMGRRNPNTGATVAYVLGAGGATHQKEISATLMNGDEIFGTDTFEFYLFAGLTAAPVGSELSELRTLATGLVDVLGPRAEYSTFLPGTDRLRVEFDQPVLISSLALSALEIDEDGTHSNSFFLDAATTVVETGTNSVLTLELTPADAAAILAMAPAALTLHVVPGVGTDASSVAMETRSVGVSVGEATAITLDGRIENDEWRMNCNLAFEDSLADSDWTATNELDAVYVRWDDTYLYLAIDGIVTANSWIMYLDTDPDGGLGQTDLTAINAWERGATFTAPGFAPDFQYAAYQHQGAFDTDGFFRLDSPTVATDLSDSILTAFDPAHVWGADGGSELAIPWNVLFGLGAGNVPTDAEIGFAVSICWDPEPAGELGGDSIPGVGGAGLPVVSQFSRFTIDANSDGLPDDPDTVGPQVTEVSQYAATGLPRRLPTDILVGVTFDELVDETAAETLSNYSLYETGNPSRTLQVRGAMLLGDGKNVELTVEEPETGGHFTLVIANATDLSCNANVTATQSATVQLERIVDAPSALANRVLLHEVCPNPFNPRTQIRFEIPASGARSVSLTVFDPRGRRVQSLIAGESLSGGEYVRTWHGRDSNGRAVASGSYIVRLDVDGVTRTQKMSLTK